MTEFVEVDGFEAQVDLTHLEEQELQHAIINHVIHLAHLRGISIEGVLESLLASHVLVKTIVQALDGSEFPDDLPLV